MNHKIFLQLKVKFYEHVHQPNIAKFWEKRAIYEENGVEEDWEANEKALQALSIPQRH